MFAMTLSESFVIYGGASVMGRLHTRGGLEFWVLNMISEDKTFDQASEKIHTEFISDHVISCILGCT